MASLRTLSEPMILEAIEDHGEYLFHATESVLAERFVDWNGECYLADILTMFRKNHRDYLIGIEIKDWKGRVHPKLCREYLKTYRKSCEYFYMAARNFSPAAHAIEEIGLIDQNAMKVLKRAGYLYPRKEARAGVIRWLKRCAPIGRDILEDPYQMSLDRFAPMGREIMEDPHQMSLDIYL